MFFHIPTRQERFLKAVARGDDAKVQRMLKAHPDLLSSVDERRQSPLIMALGCVVNTRQVERTLILAGADTSDYVFHLVRDCAEPYVYTGFLSPSRDHFTDEQLRKRDKEDWERLQRNKLDHLSWVLSQGSTAETKTALLSQLSYAVRKGQHDLAVVLRDHLALDPTLPLERLAILDDTEELLLAYWLHLAKQWWQTQTSPTAVCDQCSRDVAEGQGYLIGAWLRCEDCAYRAVLGAAARLRKDPAYFGPNALENAREYRRNAP